MQLESFSAWHNVPFATEQNGFAGNHPKLVFNGPLQVRHIADMQDWAKKGYFSYAGRKNEPEAKFFSGECAMLTSSSAAYGNIVKNAKFKFAVSPLPYYADVAGAPQNTIIGGASLWVMGGKSKDEYKAVAKFLTFLSQPGLQAEWHQATGYLPITMAAYELTKNSGFYDKNPGTDVSVKQMIVKTHRQVARRPAGQFRADPRHHRRRARKRLERQEERQGGAGCGGHARQRADRSVRKNRKRMIVRQRR